MCFPPQLTVIVTSRLRSPRDCDEVAKSESREHPKRNIKRSFILQLLCSNICEFALLLLLNQLEFPHDRSPVCFWCCYAIRRLGYIASVFCVSLPGKHISLVICVRGHTYHGETHITVTPLKYSKIERSTAHSIPQVSVYGQITCQNIPIPGSGGSFFFIS